MLDVRYQSYDHVFPEAVRYRDRTAQACIREEQKSRRAFAYSERHLHCLWFDAHLRPDELVSCEGERIAVEHPGQWNLEAGPDFLDAVLVVGPERRRIAGDVEIHIRPSDWNAHGHSGDPRYSNVMAHVCWHPGTLPEGVLPRGCLQLSLEAAVNARPSFAFEQIDLTAYPYEVESALTPLREQCMEWSPDEKMGFLDAAGEERLRLKTRRMAAAMEESGAEQALYEEMMAALGFKNNKSACRELARRLPLDRLRAEAAGDPILAYGLMLGVGGIMPGQAESHADRQTAELLRRAWDPWWKRRAAFEHRIMDRAEWNFAGTRPVNHPRRRLMAAAWLFSEDPLSARILKQPDENPRRWCDRCLHLLEVNTRTYWSRRLTLRDAKENHSIALIGSSRAVSILTNVFVPFMAASDHTLVFRQGLARALPPEPSNSIIRQTAHALFGPDHSPRLYDTGLRRQGLIQVFYDFGLGRKPVQPEPINRSAVLPGRVD